MKLLTINIHSHDNKTDIKKNQQTVKQFAEYIIKADADVIAIQECGQTRGQKPCDVTELSNFVEPKSKDSNLRNALASQTGIGNLKPVAQTIKKDNCAMLISKELEKEGHSYYWTWTSAKIGYGINDEGLAIFSKKPIKMAEEFYFSNTTDYNNWKARKAIGICIEDSTKNPKDMWIYSLHMGWWNDKEEPFERQFSFLHNYLKNSNKLENNVFLLGDFNSKSDEKGTGYDFVKNLGWNDTYVLAKSKDEGYTVEGEIDGWRKKTNQPSQLDSQLDDITNNQLDNHPKNQLFGMRIDYIWSWKKVDISSSNIIFNGKKQPVISDHFGIEVEREII